MAINYTALTSTTQASAAAAQSATLSAIVTAITANPAWSVVNNSTNVGSGNWTWITLKCDHTISGLLADYYVTFIQGGTSFYSFVHETFSTTPASSVFQISMSGAPTGGSANINIAAPSSATAYANTNQSIAFNQTAAALQTTLNSVFGAGAYVVSGGPLPTTPITITATGSYALNKWVGSICYLNALTGGASPTCTVTHTTPGLSSITLGNPVNGYFANTLMDSSGRIPATASSIVPDLVTGAPTFPGVYGNNTIGQYCNWNSNVNSLTNTTIFYNVIAYNDHILLGLGTTAAVRYVYLGGVASVAPNPSTQDPLCLISSQLYTFSTSSGNGIYGFTRVPANLIASAQTVPATLYFGSCGYFANWSYSQNLLDYPPGCPPLGNNGANSVDPISNTYLTSRFMIPHMSNVNTANSSAWSSWRAVYNNLIATSALPTGMVQGDTIGINGTYWVYLGQYNTNLQLYADTGVSFP